MPETRSLPRRALAVVALATVLAVFVGPARAQDDVVDLRAAREDARRDAAAAAAEIDALEAEDDDLVGALADLDAHIELQEQKIAAVEAAIAEAEAEGEAAAAEAAELDVEMEDIRLQVRDQAVSAFLGSGSADEDPLSTSDLTAGAVRRYLLDNVVDDRVDHVDALRSAESRQEALERIAAEAAATADTERGVLAEKVAELEVAKEEAEALRVEVQGRIADWESTAVAMEQADADLTAEIQSLEAAAAAKAAAEQAAAEQAAAEQAAAEQAAADAAAAGEESADDGSTGDASTDVEAVEAVPPPADGSFGLTHRPVPGGVSSGFGQRVHPIFGSSRMHTGVDMHGRTGDPIVAGASGTVLSAGWRNGYGNAVVVSHGGGYTTLYAHMSSISATPGASVSGGTVLGAVGSTGWSTGPHLHFEIRINGSAVNPAPYLP